MMPLVSAVAAGHWVYQDLAPDPIPVIINSTTTAIPVFPASETVAVDVPGGTLVSDFVLVTTRTEGAVTTPPAGFANIGSVTEAGAVATAWLRDGLTDADTASITVAPGGGVTGINAVTIRNADASDFTVTTDLIDWQPGSSIVWDGFTVPADAGTYIVLAFAQFRTVTASDYWPELTYSVPGLAAFYDIAPVPGPTGPVTFTVDNPDTPLGIVVIVVS